MYEKSVIVLNVSEERVSCSVSWSLICLSCFHLIFLSEACPGCYIQERWKNCRETLNRWTEYCSKLYYHRANGDPSVLNCTQTDTEDDHPILRREVEAAVQSLKKGKSAGVCGWRWCQSRLGRRWRAVRVTLPCLNICLHPLLHSPSFTSPIHYQRGSLRHYRSLYN